MYKSKEVENGDDNLSLNNGSSFPGKEFWYGKESAGAYADQIIKETIDSMKHTGLNGNATPDDGAHKDGCKDAIGSTPSNPELVLDISTKAVSDLPSEMYGISKNGKELDGATASDDSNSIDSKLDVNNEPEQGLGKRKRKISTKLEGYVGYEPPKRRALKKGTPSGSVYTTPFIFHAVSLGMLV